LLLHLTPPPPTLSLFPYTTLFRSQACRANSSISESEPSSESCSSASSRSSRKSRVPSPLHSGQAPLGLLKLSKRGSISGKLKSQDRKSTRLNSSHVKISYAVFCLK